ncbi:MAG: GNAT family N-acetyltransferase [Solirubrobacterales bacterium]|nr:GNAT family N-acetyltransferase [Solirubrobacterales bacterium]
MPVSAGAGRQALSPAVTVRRELRPGDLGAIIAQHGAVYSREYGVDSTFEGHVATSVAAAGERGWPGDGEAVWIVEVEGRHAGSLGLTDEGDGAATLRWFLLDAELRGEGLGRRLVGELVAEAERLGYETLVLETFSELRAAAHIYRGAGFELRSAQTGPRWGRDEITYQRYELSFQARAHSSSSPSAGSSARPFSVSA